ncbi:17255_t:CDS:2 [Entrophospora sp. SA101]|nr:17255_t:CDS:2 [Entrophospora sp. SA101]
MPRIHTLSDIGEGKKLGDIPSNRYPPSRTELENQLACANRDREIAIECGNRLANKYKPEDDPLAIRLRFDTPLDLRKEIQL